MNEVNGSRRYYHYVSLVSEGDGRKFVIWSIVFHFALAALLILGGRLFIDDSAVMLKGGGGLGPTIGVGLVGALPAGTEYYKPPVKPIESTTAPVETPKPKAEKPPAEEPPPKADDFKEATSKPTPEKPKETPPEKPAESTERKPAPPPAAASESPRIGTAEKPAGVVGGQAENGAGTSGNGHGVSIGGAGDGFFDSWYARQVEQRVSRNWLQARMGIQYSGHHRVVIQFDVTAAGRIENIEILKSTGPEAFERSAIRAVRASDPLPPLPNQYRMMKRIRFVAIFEYPPS